MVDYDKSTGSAGTLRIRDTGSIVEFWILCSDPSTNVGSLSWSGTINGVGVGGTVSLGAGFGAQLIDSWVISSTQVVAFNIGASGTSGLGGPTSHSATISRGPSATVPPAPSIVGFSNVTQNAMTFQFAETGDGGSPIDGWFYKVSTDPTFVNAGWQAAPMSGIVTRTDLLPGTAYHWWAYGSNAVGGGIVSERASQTTRGGLAVWDGSGWREHRVREWDGSQWRLCRVREWDGATWRQTQ